MFRIQVQAHAGYKAEEKPKAFVWKQKRVEVEQILDRWYGEDADYFKVRGDDDAVYILRYVRNDDVWELTLAEKN